MFNVLFALKRFMNNSYLKYLLSTKALRCLTQSRENYSTKIFQWGEGGAFFAFASDIQRIIT